MHTSAKSRRNRSTAVAVLLGWLFSIAVSSAYGCTLWDTAHQHDAHEAHMAHALAHDVAHGTQLHGNANSAGDADICKVACNLQASPVLKDASGNAPDLHLVVLHTSAYILVLAPISLHEPGKPGKTALPYAQSPSLRSTRLTL